MRSRRLASRGSTQEDGHPSPNTHTRVQAYNVLDNVASAMKEHGDGMSAPQTTPADIREAYREAAVQYLQLCHRAAHITSELISHRSSGMAEKRTGQ